MIYRMLKVLSLIACGVICLSGRFAWADEAPTILIEDVILNCSAPASSLTMPTSVVEVDSGRMERLLHGRIARQCKGQTVCRIAAMSLLDADIRNSGCEDLVLVPVCAVGAFESLTPGASSELPIPLRSSGYLVINCSGVANPHF